MVGIILLVLFILTAFVSPVLSRQEEPDNEGNYWIGTGIHDITGPPADVNMMGYGRAVQTAHGIHQRLWARAFVISQKMDELPNDDPDTAWSCWFCWSTVPWSRLRPSSSWERRQSSNKNNPDPDSSICFVSIDFGMGSDILHKRVLDRLDQLLSDSQTTNLCRLESLTISATHTHSGPAGFMQYAMYQIQSLGYIPQVVDILVEGIAQALFKAHLHLQPGHLYLSVGELFDANINRSPTSYLNNPEEERNEYDQHGDTDKTMMQLVMEQFSETVKGKRSSKPTKVNAQAVWQDSVQLVGLLNWFAVHPTSMNATNQLISGDNKGYASYLMEKKYNPPGMRVGDEEKHTFVAAFASTNLGDVSPNTAGPRCLDSGLPCDPITSTCHGLNELCVAFGPGRDMFESTEIIGGKQFDKSDEMLNDVLDNRNETQMPAGTIRSRHAFVDMSRLNVTLANGDIVRTCPAALGYGFAAGTIDGHGLFSFTQGSNSTNPFWNLIAGFLSQPSQEQVACQAPKPILLNTGDIHLPYDWSPNTVPISVFQINNLFILNVPGEFTTMAGRRLRKAVRQILEAHNYSQVQVTIAGLSNTYTHYITTREEYQGQRYEAASTLYGPFTLEAYIQEFGRLVQDLITDSPSRSDPPPKDSVSKQIALLPEVEVDAIGAGRQFGAVVTNAKDAYNSSSGEEVVKVVFRSANPRSNPRIMDTFLTVEQLNDHGSWKVWLTDADWDTKYIWRGGGIEYFGVSFAEIHWKISRDTPQGIYRICHSASRKTWLGNVGRFWHTVPDTMTSSAALNLLVAVGRLILDLSQQARDWLGQHLPIQHTREFHGCSSSFLVYES